jgi:hypothetical protein
VRDSCHLQKISLRLGSFLTTDEEDSTLSLESAAPLLHFLRTSSVLRSVTLKGWRYHGNRNWSHLAEPILRAVMENPCNRLVKLKLTEYANVSLETLCSFHKKTTSLKLLRVDINDHFDSSSLVLLPSALAENQTLEGVTFARNRVCSCWYTLMGIVQPSHL